MRDAIHVSINIPAIKAAIEIGPERVFERAKDFGLHFQSDTFTAGSSIAIGTLEVHMIDLISAFGAIANGGVLIPRTTILEVRDSSGTKIWPPPGLVQQGKVAVSPQAAFIMTDILAGNTDPAQNPFWSKRAIYDGATRRPATLKTGTTNDTKDLTAMGYLAPPADPKAPAFVVGAWMGNSDNSAPPSGVVSLESSASLWQAFLTAATKGQPIADFQPPPGVVQATVDAYSGMLPGPFSSKTVKEWFIDGTVPTQVDNTKVGIQVDSTSGLLWQDGCEGPPETQGFLDLSNIEADYPAVEDVQRRLDRARREGVRHRRRSREDAHQLLLRDRRVDPVWPDLGCSAPAHDDVRRGQPVADAVAVVRPARPVQPVPEPQPVRFLPAVAVTVAIARGQRRPGQAEPVAMRHARGS